MHPDVVLPNEPEFCFSEYFQGNFRPSPVMAKSIDAEDLRIAMNCFRDDFEQQKAYNLAIKVELAKSRKQEKLLRRLNVLLTLAIVAVLVIALVR